MKVISKTLPVLALGTFLTSGAVLAAPVLSVATVTGEFVFAGNSTATAKITPLANLQAGNYKGDEKIDNVEFTASTGRRPSVGKSIIGSHHRYLIEKNLKKDLRVEFSSDGADLGYPTTSAEEWRVPGVASFKGSITLEGGERSAPTGRYVRSDGLAQIAHEIRVNDNVSING
ncbi:TPA: hypothetical protein ACKP7D_003502 [Serratia marcescens]